MVRKRIVGEAVILCLKHIAEGGEELLIVGLETDVGGVVEVWGIDEAFQFLQHLGSHIKDRSADGVGVIGEGGIVVANFFDDELECAPCFVNLHTAVSHLVENILAEIFYILCLCRHILGGFDRMKVAVDEHLLFVEIALIERVAIDSCCGRFHFFESFGMDSRYGYAHASNLHNELAVAVDTDDISGQVCHVACGDAEQNAVASVVMEGVKEEAYAFG